MLRPYPYSLVPQGDPLELVPAKAVNIGLGWKLQAVTNTLAYYITKIFRVL